MSDPILKRFLSEIDKLQYRGVRPGLERIARVCGQLGHPERAYPIVHVGGTNGKGSTSFFLAQMLHRCGLSVGVSSSPHVFDFRERLRVLQDESHPHDLIPSDQLLELHYGLMNQLNGDQGLTYFEWSTLLAFELFRQKQVDAAVIEVGLGGRWDATNVCVADLSVITTIGFDHTEILGDTLEQILEEKLQIVKEGGVLLFGPQDPELKAQAQRHCENRNAKLYYVDDVLSTIGDIKNLQPSYLKRNFNVAIAAMALLQKMGWNVALDRIDMNSEFFRPNARLQWVEEIHRFLYDGAHNDMAINALKVHLEEVCGRDYHLVFGCLKNRDFLGLAKQIQGNGECFWTKFDAGHLSTSDDIYDQVRHELGGQIVSLDQTFYNELNKLELSKPIVICGSFYLCSQFFDFYRFRGQKNA